MLQRLPHKHVEPLERDLRRPIPPPCKHPRLYLQHDEDDNPCQENIIRYLHHWSEPGGEVRLLTELALHSDMDFQHREYPFKSKECRLILRQILQALEYMHGKGFVHRDVKPGNIFVISRSPIHVKLGDFGAAAFGPKHHGYCGTRDYVAPEVSNPPYTNKVDIWSVGIIALQLWVGVTPKVYLGWMAHIRERVAVATGLIGEFVSATLREKPEQRYSSSQCLSLRFVRLGLPGVSNDADEGELEPSRLGVDPPVPRDGDLGPRPAPSSICYHYHRGVVIEYSPEGQYVDMEALLDAAVHPLAKCDKAVKVWISHGAEITAATITAETDPGRKRAWCLIWFARAFFTEMRFSTKLVDEIWTKAVNTSLTGGP